MKRHLSRRARLRRSLTTAVAGALVCGAAASPAAAAPAAGATEWPTWRGSAQSGVSAATGLVDTWSKDGQNLAWRDDFVGRSTPVVFDGRVCAAGRTGSGTTMQEIVACWDAASGRRLWQDLQNVYLTTVPFNRVGWAAPVADPETGYLYHHGVGGLFTAYDRSGKIVWQRSLGEEIGHITGYGGRTQTPLVDEDRVVLSFVSTGWGDQQPPRHRIYAFDKRSGDLRWISTPGGQPYDLNTQGNPIVAVIDGQRLVIQPSADGKIWAVQARTGKPVWSFTLSKNALNTAVAVDGSTVFASHSEENVDQPSQGRLVAFRVSGSGDQTKNELWRIDELGAGFASPIFHAGTVYVIDNSANLVAVDAASGKIRWQHKLGTVGKGSPVWADGKIYATEVNGRFWIVKPGESSAQTLDEEVLNMPDGSRYAEIYASPAIGYGRVYFTTEEGIYALGAKGPATFAAKLAATPAAKPPAGRGPLAQVQVIPAETWAATGEARRFAVAAFDASGDPVAAPRVTWALDGLPGEVAADGSYTASGDMVAAGTVGAKLATPAEGVTVIPARVRIFPPLPWKLDFEAMPEGKRPLHWGATGPGSNFIVTPLEGQGKVLVKGPAERGIHRGDAILGPPIYENLVVQADVLSKLDGRRRGDICVIAGGYTFELQGGHQRAQLRSWSAMLERFSKHVDFAWEPEVWYTMKLAVDGSAKTSTVRAKVWKRGEAEPAAWTVELEDPLPIAKGSPGLCGFSPAPILFDNVEVKVNR